MRYFLYCRKSTESEDRQVLSIGSQESELRRAFEGQNGMQIVDVLCESYSAKAPGRPIFNAMMERIERGEADGILAWHPDRLARNSVDGGRIIYLLDIKQLKDLKFATFTFENNPNGKLMLQVLLGFSKYYVDSLSENVKRGNRAKLLNGWRPNHAPIGYRNDPVTKTIVKDSERFPLVRRIFDLALAGHSMWRIAMETRTWGLKTPKRKRMGGKYLSVSNVHHIVCNPFYAGILTWGGRTYPGRHEPMITLDELDRIYRILRRPGKPSPQKYYFPFTGLLRCGECGLAVTAEHKVNRYGYRYTYYHCTRRRLDYDCRQPSVTAEALDTAIQEFIAETTIPPSLHRWAIKQIEAARDSGAIGRDAEEHALRKCLDDVTRALNNLTSLRIRDLINDEDFARERKGLLAERARVEQHLSTIKDAPQWFEPAGELITFASRAISWYREGDDHVKRQIVETTGSNLILLDKKVSIEARKPFVRTSQFGAHPRLLGDLDELRTPPAGTIPPVQHIMNEIRRLWEARDPEFLETIARVRSVLKVGGMIDRNREEPLSSLPVETTAEREAGRDQRGALPLPSPRQSSGSDQIRRNRDG